MRQWFLNCLVGRLKKILNTKILLASMKHLRFLKLLLKAASEFFSGLLFLSLVGFLHAINFYWTWEKSVVIYCTCYGRFTEQFSGSHQGSGNRRLSECRNKLVEEGYWRDF
jgi:hypothetical protein